jgi:hypothetical protein
MSKKSIDERLKAHPILQGRIEAILEIVEDSAGEVERADEAAQDRRRARRLRPEARVAHYSELDKQQQQAFKKIIHLIAEAIGDLPTHDRAMDGNRQAGLPPWLERQRTSRTVFLHGERGMGKTTVSLSIIKASRRATEGCATRRGDGMDGKSLRLYR